MNILTVPDDRLRQKAVEILRVNDVLRFQIEKMTELIGDHLGLAAPQVGLNLTLFITNLDAKKVYINPIIRAKLGLQVGTEGCLSIPGVYGTVTRAREVRISAWGLDGRYFETTIKGLEAAVVQHEYDHLQGILFTDKMKVISRENKNYLDP